MQGGVADDAALHLDEADTDSIRVHGCHSARREVEVLHDVLLDVFATTDIRPGDVAVVTPDPDAYRPFVEEVFRGAEQPMAVHVAGARRGGAEAGAEVMMGALNLVGTRYKVPDVLDWLETEPVLGSVTDRTGLRHTLHNWILRQRIRWGIDSRQLQSDGFALSGRHTWKHGVNRLLLSWLAAEGEEVVVDELMTGSTVAGQEAGQLLGRFAEVIEVLADLQHASVSPRPIPEWVDLLTEVAHRIFTETPSGREYSASTLQALHTLRGMATTLNLHRPVPFTIVRRYLSDLLDSGGLGRAWKPGAITFTGMVALHQIPFRVVAILGLNDGLLPGKTPVSAFDLIPGSPRDADRSRRDADRQLFLDYLLTPDVRLHLSYTGMRQKDNKELAPSVMLTMLEDFLTEKTPREKRSFLRQLRVKHALQPFNPVYFTPTGSGTDAGTDSGTDSATNSSSAPSDNAQGLSLGEASSKPPSNASGTYSYSVRHRDLAAALTGNRAVRPPLFDETPSIPGSAPHPATASSTDGDQNLPPHPATPPGETDATSGPANPSPSAPHLPTPQTELTLVDLQRFFRDPVKALLRQSPGLVLDESEVPVEASEPFSFDTFTGWQVRSQVMKTWLETGDLEYRALEAHLRRDGALAEGQAGRKQMRTLVAELNDFIGYVEEQAGSRPRFTSMETDCTITSLQGTSFRIAAAHPYLLDQTAWNFEAGKMNNMAPARKKVPHYLAHLVLNTSAPIQSRILFRDGKELVFRPLETADADSRLQTWLTFFELGHTLPLPFFPACMLQYRSHLLAGHPAEVALKLLLDDLEEEPGPFPKDYHHEQDSLWIQEAFGDMHPIRAEADRWVFGLGDKPGKLTPEHLASRSLFSLMAVTLMDMLESDILKQPE